MKIAYFGSPSFSATLLEKLILDKSLGIEIVLVVTQPDKPVGRKMIMTPSPVKVIAQKYGIPLFNTAFRNEGNDIFTTRDVRSGMESVSEQARGDKNGITGMNFFDELKKVDLGLVYAFGFKQLIPLDLLKAPKMQFEIGEGKTSGFVNVHPSLLPLYRGSSPIAYPISLGENKTGVTLFVMDEKMDHGPIIDQQEMEITLTDVRTDMEIKLTGLGFEMIKEFLISTDFNRFQLIQQDHSLATRSPYMIKDDGFIPLPILQKALKNEPLTLQELPQIMRKYLSRHPERAKRVEGSLHFGRDDKINSSSKIIYDFWRGMHPWPGLWTLVKWEGPKRLKIVDLQLYNFKTLKLVTVQLEGKSPVDFATFQKAYNVFE